MSRVEADCESPHSASSAEVLMPKSSFVTASNVLEELNAQLSDSTTVDGNGTASQDQKPFFELQKRLPDGSTMPATKDEIAAADFKTKLEQSAQFISQLKSSEDRQCWAEQQRLSGNAFFQRGEIREAMDIYLTCLIVKEENSNFMQGTFLPVLNNLAQCTSQLGMHKKTILFCEMALEEASKANQKVKNHDEKKSEHKIREQKQFLMQRDIADAIALCKIFFKLAKALRLTGHYRRARKALDSSLNCLTTEENNGLSSTGTSMSYVDDVGFSLLPYKKAIQKEYRCLDVAEKEAKRNLARQKLAMEKVMSLSSAVPHKISGSQDINQIQEKNVSSDYSHEPSSEVRQFSKLRSRKSENDDTNAYEDYIPQKISYRQYYLSMVARVAKALLFALDENYDFETKESLTSDSADAMTKKKDL
mmetsp:Transcript_2935/g.8053  ORF Transcript_2935/g.8053 Transcript_2935/m.8053 type:complete len:420 (+) Transcript_2935:51-1310(+)